MAWGNFDRFVQYTGQLNWFLPHVFIKPLAWTATALEAVPACWSSSDSTRASLPPQPGCSLLAFALTMTLALSVRAPLDLSVFSACAGVFLLAAISRSPCAECWSRQKKKYRPIEQQTRMHRLPTS